MIKWSDHLKGVPRTLLHFTTQYTLSPHQFSSHSKLFLGEMASNVTRVALVTGAAQGIGRGVALRLAADGFDVAINDLQVKASELEDVACEIRMLNRQSLILIADVSEETQVKDMVSRVVEEFGGLDVVCPLIVVICAYINNTLPKDDRKCRCRAVEVSY